MSKSVRMNNDVNDDITTRYERYKSGELTPPNPDYFDEAYFRVLLTNPDNYFGPYHEWFERPTYLENNDFGEIKTSSSFKAKKVLKKVKDIFKI